MLALLNLGAKTYAAHHVSPIYAHRQVVTVLAYLCL